MDRLTIISISKEREVGIENLNDYDHIDSKRQ